MRLLALRIACVGSLVSLYGIVALGAQQPQAPGGAALVPVPRLVWFSGTFHPANGLPLAPVETVAVSVYRDREGGDAVWQETQTVAIESDGRDSLLLGSMSADGLPLDLFTAGEPRRYLWDR
jgi:hypothetical protein